MIKILFLACNPLGTERILIDEEARVIDKSLRSADHRDTFEIQTHWAVRASELQELLLRHQPNIVHFSGHGTTSDGIILQDDLGKAYSVPIDALSSLFSQLSEDIHCVVLNAYYSKAQAEVIAEHIDCVVGMNDTITDQAAISFSSAFYLALGYGRDVKSAFGLACGQIHLKGFDEHNTPVFITNKKDIDKIILEPFDDSELKEVRPQIEDTLPSRETIAVDFIGRQRELSILEDWFNEPESKIWVLAGDGGKGKTAIAYEFAVQKRNQSPADYHIILWLSAKRRRFVEGIVVYIDDPDFIDLDTAIDKLLDGYGFGVESKKPLEEKKQIVIELLTKLPAILIVDDIDSLEGEAENAIAFFTQEVTRTPTKVLLTSRRSLFGYGGVTTQIAGFSRNEGISFGKSRINLFGLNPRPIAPYLERITRITDGSPLYIEELLRLCKVGVGIKEAIEAWDGVEGNVARAYSLNREFDMLGENAKQVLLACCLNRRPSTIAEIEVITGLKKNPVLSAVEEIERLFLLPKPTIIKEAPRFDININTRSLILDVMRDSDLYHKLDVNVKRLSGEIRITGKRRKEISEYLKHSSTLMQLGLLKDAESILKDATGKYQEDPDILAQFGKMYAHWKPVARINEAKHSFNRAAVLKCSQEDMYHHWWSLECRSQEWSKAVEAGESGIKQFPKSWILKYKAGYAHSRLGGNLRSQFQRDRARYQLIRAKSLLIEALVSVKLDELDHYEHEIHSDILRSLVITTGILGHTKDTRKYLLQWLNDHPDDLQAIQYRERLKEKLNLKY